MDEANALASTKKNGATGHCWFATPTVYERERATARAQIGVVWQAAVIRVKELERQRKVILAEMAFYENAPAKPRCWCALGSKKWSKVWPSSGVLLPTKTTSFSASTPALMKSCEA